MPATQTVIAGAGPMGLLLAIELHFRGVKELVVVDPHLGEYVRPGDLEPKVIADITKRINQLYAKAGRKFIPPEFSAARHIKELERFLYRVAGELGITFRRETLQAIEISGQQASLLLVDNEGREVRRPVRNLFDCTGTKRAAMLALNKALSKPYFIFRQSVTPTMPRHGFFMGWIQDTTLPFYRHPSVASDDERYVAFERLRELGWQRFVFPDCHLHACKTKEGRAKVRLYMEIPGALKPEELHTWTKALLLAYSNGSMSDIEPMQPSSKGEWKDRVRQTCFTLDLRMVNKPGGFHLDNFDLYSLGDAFATTDYRKGKGIRSHVKCLDLLLSYLPVHDGILQRLSVVEQANLAAELGLEQRKMKAVNKEVHQTYRAQAEKQEALRLCRAYKAHQPNHPLIAALSAFNALDLAVTRLALSPSEQGGGSKLRPGLYDFRAILNWLIEAKRSLPKGFITEQQQLHSTIDKFIDLVCDTVGYFELGLKQPKSAYQLCELVLTAVDKLTLNVDTWPIVNALISFSLQLGNYASGEEHAKQQINRLKDDKTGEVGKRLATTINSLFRLYHAQLREMREHDVSAYEEFYREVHQTLATYQPLMSTVQHKSLAIELACLAPIDQQKQPQTSSYSGYKIH